MYKRPRKHKALSYYKVDQSALEFFELNTYDLTEHDRHDLILDYFDKVRVLLYQDVEHYAKDVQEINPARRGEIHRMVQRMRKSQELIYDLDFLVDQYKRGDEQ